jgi:hypothetical protein
VRPRPAGRPPCPACGGRRSHVLHTQDDGRRVTRRRHCDGCGYRFTTDEVALHTGPLRFVRIPRLARRSLGPQPQEAAP